VELPPKAGRQKLSGILKIANGLAGTMALRADVMKSNAIPKYEMAKYARTPESRWAKVILNSL
jgi:hypothetical protein